MMLDKYMNQNNFKWLLNNVYNLDNSELIFGKAENLQMKLKPMVPMILWQCNLQ